MGRDKYSNKKTAAGLLCIDMCKLKKLGYLVGFILSKLIWRCEAFEEDTDAVGVTISVSNSSGYMRLQYTRTNTSNQMEDLDYKIEIVATRCYYGGVRYWFLCPLEKDGKLCQKRVRILYLGNNKFGCR